MAYHYFPGYLIPLPLDSDGFTDSWNNAFVRSLPPDDVYPEMGPGYDRNRPFGQTNGAQTVIYQINGEGKSVDIVCTGSFQGPAMTLWCPGHPEERKLDNQGNPSPWVEYSSSSSYYPRNDPNFVVPSTAIRHFLAAGKTYYIEIGSASYDSSMPSGTGYDQDFVLTTTNTPDSLNDFRDDAYDVIIPTDNATYISPDVLNTNFTSANNSTDDPLDSDVFYTGWWKYEATKATSLTVAWAIVPQNSNWFGIRVYRQELSGAMTLLGSASNNPSSFTVNNIAADDLIYIQIGSRYSTNGLQPRSQQYQLQVTGAQSKVQLPPGDGGSGGDGGDGGGGTDPGNGGGGGGGGTDPQTCVGNLGRDPLVEMTLGREPVLDKRGFMNRPC